MKKLCIYHGNCADGFGAAWAIRKALGYDVEFHPGVYGQEYPDVTGRQVILADFSYKRLVLEGMAASAQSILILDHHKTAATDLEIYPEPPFLEDHRGWIPDSGIYATFDMERSGAAIAWDHFHLGVRPTLINHIQDRDLWKFELEGTREIQADLFSYPYDFDVWDKLMDMGTGLMINSGRSIERKHFKDIAELLPITQRRMIIAGHNVPVANLPYIHSSDAGHQMAIGEPFAACYMDGPDGRTFSLRSADDGLDVSDIAKLFGGGGHARAAGFFIKSDNPEIETLSP